jgi:hypothetical protein
MATQRRTARILPVFVVIAALSCIPIFGDTHTALPSALPEFHCYCECEGHDGKSICPKKMCEIPKYEKRWWATSCHKRETDPSASRAPASQPDSRRTRNVLDAKNQ